MGQMFALKHLHVQIFFIADIDETGGLFTLAAFSLIELDCFD